MKLTNKRLQEIIKEEVTGLKEDFSTSRRETEEFNQAFDGESPPPDDVPPDVEVVGSGAEEWLRRLHEAAQVLQDAEADVTELFNLLAILP